MALSFYRWFFQNQNNPDLTTRGLAFGSAPGYRLMNPFGFRMFANCPWDSVYEMTFLCLAEKHLCVPFPQWRFRKVIGFSRSALHENIRVFRFRNDLSARLSALAALPCRETHGNVSQIFDSARIILIVGRCIQLPLWEVFRFLLHFIRVKWVISHSQNFIVQFDGYKNSREIDRRSPSALCP